MSKYLSQFIISRSLKCAVNARVRVEWEQPLLTKCPNGYATHPASDSKVLTLLSRGGTVSTTKKDEKRGTGALTSCSGQMEFISPKAVHLGEGTLCSQNHSAVESITAGLPASMRQNNIVVLRRVKV